MSMHRLRYTDGSDDDAARPRVFGELKCKGVSMNRRQRTRVEKEVLALIQSHGDWRGSDEIQYWISFEKPKSEMLVSCKVGIINGASVWEDSEYSQEPFKAFRKCLEYLSPSVVLDLH